jgi:hypothetical protein
VTEANGDQQPPQRADPPSQEAEPLRDRIPIVASSSVNWSKRSFLLALFTTAFGGGFVYNQINQVLEKQQRHREMISELLFGNAHSQYYVPAFDNPYAPVGGMTLPTRDALNSIFQRIGFSPDQVRNLESPYTTKVDGTLVVLGGPVPNKLSRSIMGQGSGSPLFSDAMKKRVDLPVHFSNIVSEKQGVGNRPNYRIILKGQPLRAADEGVDDFLVITSIPNVCSPSYHAFNHRIVNIAGFHGAGMRAIDLVLESGFVEKIHRGVTQSEALKGAPGWQALVRVEVDKANKGMPVRLGEWKVFRIDDVDFAQVHSHVRAFGIEIDQNNRIPRRDGSVWI